MAIEYLSADTAPLYRDSTGNSRILDLLWGDRVSTSSKRHGRTKVRARGAEGWVDNASLGGESLLDHKARVLRFIAWLQRQPDRCALVVAHEETLRVFEAWFRALPDAALRSLQFDNCALQRYRL